MVRVVRKSGPDPFRTGCRLPAGRRSRRLRRPCRPNLRDRGLGHHHRRLRLDAVSDDFGRVAVVAFLVLPLASLEAALDEDRAALGQVLLAVLGGAAPDHDGVPFGAFLTLPALVVPCVRGRNPQRGHRFSARGVSELGILAEIAKDHNLVY
jgi:hypothetical protein